MKEFPILITKQARQKTKGKQKNTEHKIGGKQKGNKNGKQKGT
jgi:hypothetical protein